MDRTPLLWRETERVSPLVDPPRETSPQAKSRCKDLKSFEQSSRGESSDQSPLLWRETERVSPLVDPPPETPTCRASLCTIKETGVLEIVTIRELGLVELLLEVARRLMLVVGRVLKGAVEIALHRLPRGTEEVTRSRDTRGGVQPRTPSQAPVPASVTGPFTVLSEPKNS